MTGQSNPYIGTSANDMMRAGYPAFPDMTLRDRFALSALAALIAEPVSEAYESTVRAFSRGLKGPDAFAHVAYRMADAMLRARQEANHD